MSEISIHSVIDEHREYKIEYLKGMARQLILEIYEQKIDNLGKKINNLNNLNLGDLFDEVYYLADEAGISPERKEAASKIQDILMNYVYSVEEKGE